MRRLLLLMCLTALVAPAGCQRWRSITGKRRREPIVMPTPSPEVTDAQRARLAEAESAKSVGDYDAALSLFHEILAENPTIVPAYLGIGEIHLIREDYHLAEPAYRRAARLEPRNYDAQYGHGLALQLLDRLADAIRAYQRALNLRPESFDANLNLATTYLQLDDPYEALAYAEQAVRLRPSSGPARVNLGAIYEKLDRNAEAIEAYQTANELMDPSPPLLMNLISVLAKERRYRQAANVAENLVRVAPSAAAYERLGWSRFRLSEYEASQAAYRAAIELDPGYWPALNGVGVNALNDWLLSKRRDREAANEAKWAFRESLQRNPEQQRIINLLSRYGF